MLTVQGKVLSVNGQHNAFCCYLAPVFSYSTKILYRHLPCMKIESCSPWYFGVFHLIFWKSITSIRFLEKRGYNAHFLREILLYQFIHPADVVELKNSDTAGIVENSNNHCQYLSSQGNGRGLDKPL